MNKLSQNILITLSLLPNTLFAGGWVANGIGGESSTLSASSYTDEEPNRQRDQNFFLLKDGEMSTTLGVIWLPERITETVTIGSVSAQQVRTNYESSPAILFSWGISKDWTWSNYLSLRYNLYSRDRTDLALSFGPAEGGLGYETASGFYMAPGASLLHSYYLGAGFRLISRLGASGRFQSKTDLDNAHFSFDSGRLSTTLAKTFGESLTLSLSGLSYIGYQRESTNSRIKKNWSWHILTASPSVGVAVALGKHSELGLDVAFDNATLNSDGGPTTALYLQTRF